METTTASTGLADEVIHSFLASKCCDVDLIMMILDQIADWDLEVDGYKLQYCNECHQDLEFYKKNRQKAKMDGKMHVHLIEKSYVSSVEKTDQSNGDVATNNDPIPLLEL
ncbi:hypothetical protein Tco_1490384 [Tanacetum coccineum]